LELPRATHREPGLARRFVIALEQSLIGGTDRTRYSEEAGISPASATNDFRRLLDAGLLTQHGRGRSTRYLASDSVREQVALAIAQRHADDANTA